MFLAKQIPSKNNFIEFIHQLILKKLSKTSRQNSADAKKTGDLWLYLHFAQLYRSFKLFLVGGWLLVAMEGE